MQSSQSSLESLQTSLPATLLLRHYAPLLTIHCTSPTNTDLYRLYREIELQLYRLRLVF